MAIIDPLGLPKISRFTLRIKRTDFIFPKDPAVMLHADKAALDLRAVANKDAIRSGTRENALRGGVREDALRSGTREDGLRAGAREGALRSGTRENAQHAEVRTDTLRGHVAENNRDSKINTREHDVKPRFVVDLHKLTATSAPELSWLVDAKIKAARLKVAGDVEIEENLMEKELHARQPQPDMPRSPLTAGVGVAPAQSRELAAELAASKQHEKQRTDGSVRHYQEELSHARAPGEKMPGIPAQPIVLAPTKPVGKPAPVMPSVPQVDTSAAERQMAAQLANAKSNTPTEAELSARLGAAQQQSQQSVRYAQPAMDMILTSVRKVPPLRMPTSSSSEPMDKDGGISTIEWDAWHARFAQLARDPILKCVADSKNSEGTDAVEITVLANHRLSVRLVEPGNGAFDQAMLRAYRMLDGNSALQFPAGSRRSSITFLVDNKHTGSGVPSGVQSQASTGDREFVPSRP